MIEKTSPSAPFSSYAALGSLTSGAQTLSHLRILADFIPVALVRAFGLRLRSEYQVKDKKRSHNW